MALIQGPARDLIGQPIGHRTAPEPALVIIPTGALDMAKATQDGTYTDKNGDTFVMRKGQTLPDGAVPSIADDVVDEPVEEERAKPAAPENKAKAKAAPENRSA